MIAMGQFHGIRRTCPIACESSKGYCENSSGDTLSSSWNIEIVTKCSFADDSAILWNNRSTPSRITLSDAPSRGPYNICSWTVCMITYCGRSFVRKKNENVVVLINLCWLCCSERNYHHIRPWGDETLYIFVEHEKQKQKIINKNNKLRIPSKASSTFWSSRDSPTLSFLWLPPNT